MRDVGAGPAGRGRAPGELDDRQEKIGYKIREAQLQKIPYMLVVGDREAAEGTVGVRQPGRAGTQGAPRRSTIHRDALNESRDISAAAAAPQPQPSERDQV